jgi:hypothetical protein
MIIYVDIDETICSTPESRDYSLASPIMDRIEKVNKLYDDGHTIVYWTARGSGTGKLWENMTYKQLYLWGCKFHELKMGKPCYDLFIDDKNINSESFFAEL